MNDFFFLFRGVRSKKNCLNKFDSFLDYSANLRLSEHLVPQWTHNIYGVAFDLISRNIFLPKFEVHIYFVKIIGVCLKSPKDALS